MSTVLLPYRVFALLNIFGTALYSTQFSAKFWKKRHEEPSSRSTDRPIPIAPLRATPLWPTGRRCHVRRCVRRRRPFMVVIIGIHFKSPV